MRAAPAAFASYLLQPVRAIGLCWFRRAFALAIVYDSVRLAQRGELEDYFAPAGRMHFTYGWPLPTPPRLATEHIVRFPWIICLSAAGFGRHPSRLCLATFIVAYWWLFLADAVRYVNHYYLYALHGILLLVAARRGSDGAACRAWIARARAQWTIVYFYAGLAKCNAEFVLRGEPLRTSLRWRSQRDARCAPLSMASWIPNSLLPSVLPLPSSSIYSRASHCGDLVGSGR